MLSVRDNYLFRSSHVPVVIDRGHGTPPTTGCMFEHVYDLERMHQACIGYVSDWVCCVISFVLLFDGVSISVIPACIAYVSDWVWSGSCVISFVLLFDGVSISMIPF